MKSQRRRSPTWLPQLNYQVWILALGRLLSQVGTGFTLFYAPIFFVNVVGLPAAAVGLGLGSASIAGVIGRVLGGSLSDQPRWGRKRIVLLSALVSAIGSVILALTYNFPIFVFGNLLMGFGIGLYWPATEALVADLTNPAQRNEAYAVNRLADHLGLGLGVVLGGALIQVLGAYRSLFVIDAASYVVFFGLVWVSIHEIRKVSGAQIPFLAGWQVAMRDRVLLVYVLVNVMITTYIAQIQSTLPLYFSNFVTTATPGKGFPTATISALFAWHLVACVLSQLPVTRIFQHWRHSHMLMLSVLLWGIGFLGVWATGVSHVGAIGWAVLSLGILAIATVTYTPVASTLVVELAPPSLRGVYLSINSQCWAIGYFIGPPLGGLALDYPRPIPDEFWLLLTASVGLALLILRWLDRLLRLRPHTEMEI